MSKFTKADQSSAKERLSSLKPGETVYTVLRHVSQSGMLRIIDLLKMEDGKPVNITWNAALAMNEPLNRDGRGIRVSGCGMDMGFHLVYNLGYVLYPNGFECVGEKCRSNDHSNGDRNYKPHHHKDGGYAFKQEWL